MFVKGGNKISTVVDHSYLAKYELVKGGNKISTVVDTG